MRGGLAGASDRRVPRLVRVRTTALTMWSVNMDWKNGRALGGVAITAIAASGGAFAYAIGSRVAGWVARRRLCLARSELV